jgi:hypothetical protein
MIKFFRHIRQRLLREGRTTKYLTYALGEIVLVVIGILMALQINTWNEQRKDQKEQYFLLTKLQSDISSDMEQVEIKLSRAMNSIDNYKACLDILADETVASREEFMSRFGDILSINQFDQNTTTFDNLVTSGKIELIENESLLEMIVGYYNKEYKAWDTAMRDYTRNIIAPYMMTYDHIPQMNQTSGANYEGFETFFAEDIYRFDVQPRRMEDYRGNVFIINTLRQKIFNYQGQKSLYLTMQKEMEELQSRLAEEIDRLRSE